MGDLAGVLPVAFPLAPVGVADVERLPALAHCAAAAKAAGSVIPGITLDISTRVLGAELVEGAPKGSSSWWTVV